MTFWTASRSFAGFTAACLVLSSAAFAQDVQRTLEEIDGLLAKNEYVAALDRLQSIPENIAATPHVRKHLGFALALDNLGRADEVMAHIEEARGIAQAHNDVRAQARVELVEGNFRRRVKRGGSVHAYERAVALALKSGDRQLLAEAYARLSLGYQDMEDWGRALHYSERSFELRDAPTVAQRFAHTMERGIAYFEMYDRDAAEAAFQAGLKLAMKVDKRAESFAVGELGFVYWTFDKDVRQALDHYDRAIALVSDGLHRGLGTNWLLNRGNVFRDTGDYARALADYERVLEIETALKIQRNTIPATKNIGQTYRLMRRNDEARRILEPLVAGKAGSASPRHLWQAHMELASTYEALGRTADAARQYAAMIDVVEEQRNTAILDSFRTGSFAHTLQTYDPYERYIRFLTNSSAAPEQTARSFELSERARARSFLEMLASVRSSVAATVPPALLDEENRIIQSISDVQAKLRAPDVTKADRDALLAALAEHERARDAFRLKLRVEQPSLAETRYPDVAGPRDLQPILRDDETVVSFFLGESGSFRWTLTRDRISFHRLPDRKTIEAQAARLRTLIRAPGDIRAARTEADALAALLFADLELATGGLVVIPHGILHYVPFEILPHRGELLIERHAISYAPSLNALAFLRRQRSNPAPVRVLAVGAPSVEARATASTRGDVDTAALLGPLPFASEELDAIRRAFPSAIETLSGPAARETALRRSDLKTFRLLHFATHGLVSETHPSRSALLLSPEAGEDGLLQMGDIYRLGLNTDLVVLSACQTALGREITGEGIVGLTRAFFYGGSRAVIAALWNVNDRFAADFVERFYGEVNAGRSPQEALRATKLAFVDDSQFGHPFYWSSLVLSGDGARPLYTADSVQTFAWWPWAFAAVLLLGFAIAVRFRRATA